MNESLGHGSRRRSGWISCWRYLAPRPRCGKSHAIWAESSASSSHRVWSKFAVSTGTFSWLILLMKASVLPSKAWGYTSSGGWERASSLIVIFTMAKISRPWPHDLNRRGRLSSNCKLAPWPGRPGQIGNRKGWEESQTRLETGKGRHFIHSWRF